MSLRIGSVRLALCALLIGTVSAWALTPHDKAVGVKAERHAKDGIQAQQNASSEPQKAPESASIIPSVHASGGDGEGQPKAQEGTEEGTEFWPPLHGYRFKVTDSIIAVFTALLFFATLALWWSTRSLVRGADKTAERQIRAYVGIESQKMDLTGDVPVYHLSLKNFGLTPAFKIIIEINSDLRSPDNKEKLPRPTSKTTCADLYPSQIQYMSVPEKEIASDQEWDDIRGDRMKLYFYGVIRYIDCFGNLRKTRFRSVLLHEFELNHGGHFAICPRGNDST